MGSAAAFGSSLCCIPPLLALFAGGSGLMANLSWLSPLRPYLIGFTVLVIGWAWVRAYRKPIADDCLCETPVHKKHGPSKVLILASAFAALAITFPFYADVFVTNMPTAQADPSLTQTIGGNIKQLDLQVQGITCDACANHIQQETTNMNGVLSTKASYPESTVTITYDSNTIEPTQIITTIERIGYTVSTTP